jgi:phosphoribosylanthranilate isomerase
MKSVRIKICGITRVEDALAAARAGADAVGIVLHKSAGRYVPPDRARQILEALPPFVTPVGLFVDAPVDEIRATARLLGIRHVQLHGREEPAVVANLPEFIVLKAIQTAEDSFRAELKAWRDAISKLQLTNLRGIVLETAGHAAGGTGMGNNWPLVAACKAEGLFDGLPSLIAAGGLNPENVASVIRQIEPWAVDVSSGVEETRGIKSHPRIEAFIAAARSVK